MPRTASRYGGGGIYYDKRARRWRAQVSIDGKRRTVGTAATRGEATSLLNAYLAGDRPLPSAVPGSTATMGERLEWWRDVIMPSGGKRGAPLAPRTIGIYRRIADELAEAIGEVRLAALTTEHVEAYLLERAHLSRASLRLRVSVLRQVLEECERRGQVGRNVARYARIPATAPKAVERRALTGEECRQLLDEARGHDLEHLIALDLRTGARRNELLGLPWSAVDLEAGTMTIGQALRATEISHLWEMGPTKSGNVRTVRLDAEAVAILRARDLAQKADQLAAKVWLNAERLVFTRSSGARLDPGGVSRRFGRIADAAGLEGVVFHELRHTVGSHAVEAGVPLSVVADQLGHSSLDQVSRIYRHKVRPVVEGVAAIMSGVLADTATAWRRRTE